MRDEDLKFLASSEKGRRFLGDMFQRFGLFDRPLVEDEKTSNFRGGRRSVVLEIADQMFTIDVKSFTLIIEEWKERENYDRHRRDTERDRARDESGGRPQYYVPVGTEDGD